VIGIGDNALQCLTDCLGLQLLDPRLMRRKSNMRMTARASCKTDKKVQLSLLPSVSYSPCQSQQRVDDGVDDGGGRRSRRQRRRKEISLTKEIASKEDR